MIDLTAVCCRIYLPKNKVKQNIGVRAESSKLASEVVAEATHRFSLRNSDDMPCFMVLRRYNRSRFFRHNPSWFSTLSE